MDLNFDLRFPNVTGRSYITQFIFLPDSLACNFDDSHICNWDNARGDDFDWVVGRSTPTLTTGPARDHTTRRGKFLKFMPLHIKCHAYYYLVGAPLKQLIGINCPQNVKEGASPGYSRPRLITWCPFFASAL